MATLEMTTDKALKDGPARISALGTNGKEPQTAVVLPANATVLADTITLVNAIKVALVANGICA